MELWDAKVPGFDERRHRLYEHMFNARRLMARD